MKTCIQHFFYTSIVMYEFEFTLTDLRPHYLTASRTALGPTQPPIEWVPAALSPGVKQLGRETDHLPPSSAEVKNAWSYTSIPPIHFMTLCISTGTTLRNDKFSTHRTASHKHSGNASLLFYPKRRSTMRGVCRSV
jgi:hypothetical protein